VRKKRERESLGIYVLSLPFPLHNPSLTATAAERGSIKKDVYWMHSEDYLKFVFHILESSYSFRKNLEIRIKDILIKNVPVIVCQNYLGPPTVSYKKVRPFRKISYKVKNK
jgi:hypothetical protein